jgi:FixJ family two-component response regulator
MTPAIPTIPAISTIPAVATIPAAPTIHVVDDDESFLRAVSRFLRASGFAVATFDSAASFLTLRSADAEGCVVVDLRMPGVGGLELQDVLVERGDAMPVVFLTGEGDIPSTVRAMRRGAEDFLSKRAPKEELLDAVTRALARDARQRADRARLRALRAPFDALTPREREVLDHVLRGQLNKQIARDLDVDERSVKRHRTSVMAKLGVESVPELMDLVHAARLHAADPAHPAPSEPVPADRP